MDYAQFIDKIPKHVLHSLLTPVKESVVIQYNQEALTCLQITGLPVVYSNSDCTALEHTIYEIFEQEFKIDAVYVPKGLGMGFVKVFV